MTATTVTPTQLGSLEGATVGSFVVPTGGTADGDTVVVSDTGVGKDSYIFLQPKGAGGNALRCYVSSISAGVSFTVTLGAGGTLSGPVTVWYLRTE